MSVYHGFNKIDPAFALDVTGNVRINSDQVRFGANAGVTNQGIYAISLGLNAGSTGQSANAIAVGTNAGQTNQGLQSVAIGFQSGLTGQSANAIAVGTNAGQTNQGLQSVAIGTNAGLTGQGASSIAIGIGAGQTNQPANTIVMNASGATLNAFTANAFYVKPVRNSTTSNVLYYNANTNEISYGSTTQITPTGTNWGDYMYWSNTANQWNVGNTNVIIGKNAGLTNQGLNAIAIGESAGQTNQNPSSIALGYQAGQSTQNQWSIALGYQAGQSTQGQWATAIGYQAGQTGQGQNAVAIGYLAGQTNQPAQSIVINGSLAGITSTLTTGAFYVKPIRNLTGQPSTLSYNAISNEISYVNTWLNNATGVYYNTGTVAIGTTPVAGQSFTVSANNTVGISYVRTGAKDARITVGDPTKLWSVSSGWATAGDWSLIEEGSSGIRLYAAKTSGANVFAGVLIATPQYTWDVNGTVHYAAALATSDIRIKTNIVLNDPKEILKKIRNIQSYTFEWSNLVNECRAGYPLNTPTIGLIAQEIEPEYPSVVGQTWQMYYPDGNLAMSNVMGVDTDSMVSLLTGAVNQLNVCPNKYSQFNLGTIAVTNTSNNILAASANNLFAYPYESYNVSDVSVQYVTTFRGVNSNPRLFAKPFITVNSTDIYSLGDSVSAVVLPISYNTGESFTYTFDAIYPSTSIPDVSNISYGLSLNKTGGGGNFTANISLSAILKPLKRT